jgi:hypothetical protein
MCHCFEPSAKTSDMDVGRRVGERTHRGERLPHVTSSAASHRPCCDGCAQRRESIDRGLAIPPSVLAVLERGGQPLPASFRAEYEPYFQHDLSAVRIHTDELAQQAARDLGALAFTAGDQIVVDFDVFRGGSSLVRQVWKHELTHVVQQSRQRDRGYPRFVGDWVLAPDNDWELSAQAWGRAERPTAPAQALARFEATEPLLIMRLGSNPGCTQGERELLHQGIFNANGWVNNALKKLAVHPLSKTVLSSLRANFGNTYGVAANLDLFQNRIRYVRNAMNRMPIGCNSTDQICVNGHCGFANAGSLAATICTATLQAGVDWRFIARCILHEAFHAAFSRFTPDSYSTGHGTSSSSAGYPGTGVDPLLNADSYATLVMDLS